MINFEGNQLSRDVPKNGNSSLAGLHILKTVNVQNVLRWIEVRNRISHQRSEIINNGENLRPRNGRNNSRIESRTIGISSSCAGIVSDGVERRPPEFFASVFLRSRNLRH